MKFMLLIYGDERQAAAATPEQNQAVADEYERFTRSIRETGNFLDGDPFVPTSSSSTVQVRDGRGAAIPGPVVKTDPQLLAYYKVEAANEKEAVALAERVPGARFGSIEVRRVAEFD